MFDIMHIEVGNILTFVVIVCARNGLQRKSCNFYLKGKKNKFSSFCMLLIITLTWNPKLMYGEYGYWVYCLKIKNTVPDTVINT